jgi:hypothetical protein
VVTGSKGSQTDAAAVARVLASSFAGAGQVVVVGARDEVARLTAAIPGGFVPLEELDDRTPEPGIVLALGLAGETLGQASSTARRLGSNRVFVLAEGGGEGDLDRLRAAGLAAIETERLVWRPPPDGVPAASRAERLEAETGASLLRCVLVDDRSAVEELEAEVARLRAELLVRQQLEVEHAATREAERARAERLRELEEAFERLGGLELAAEATRLQAELDAVRATRVWRFGTAWWRLRDRILRR